MAARVLLACAVALGCGLWAWAQSAPGPFQNGSFETPTVGGEFNTLGAGDSTLVGWTVGGAGIDHIGSYWTASAGSQSIDLNAVDAGTLAQSFATVPGTSYLVRFDLAGNPFCGTTLKTLRASAAGAQQDYSFDTSGRSLSAMGWAAQTFAFTASAAASTLTFASQTSSACGPALDNVRVFAAPGSVSATPGNAWATVSWTAPAETGGAAITNYTVTASPGGRQCVTNPGAATSCVVTGLTNGTAHSFTVTATSAADTSPASPASNSVTPAGVAGPLDAVSTTAAAGFSVRQLRAAYSGPVMRLRHGTHNAEADLFFNTDGSFSTASPVTVTAVGSSSLAPNQSLTLAQFANGGDVVVRTWYDQGPSSRHAGNGTAAGQPRLMAAGVLDTLNTRPKLVFNGSTSGLRTSSFGNALPMSFQVVWRVNAYKNFGVVFGNLAANNIGLHTASSWNAPLGTYLFNGGPYWIFDTPGTTSARLAHIEYNAAGSRVWLNGSPLGPASVGGGMLDGLSIGNVFSGGESFNGDIPELIALSSAASTGERNTLTSSQSQYFGIAATVPPGAPTAATATAGNAWATVNWTAPADTGGSPITNYTVTASPGGRQCVTNSGAATSCVVTGLTNGTAHTFTVTATNALGVSAPSTVSNSVTPTGAAGMLDSVGGAALGYSVRQLRAAYSGAVMRVRHGIHNAAADLYFDTSGNLTLNNVLSITAAGSSSLAVNQSMTLAQFANGGSVFAQIWFDQSGNLRHASQTTTSLQPELLSSGSLRTINGRAALRFNADALAHEGVPTTGSAAWTFFGVATHEAGFTELFGWGDNSATGRRAGVWLDAGLRNTLEVRNAGRFGSTIATNTALIRTWRYGGGTLDAGLSGWINGAAETLTSDTTTLDILSSGQTVIGDVPRAIGAHPHRGQMGEIVVYASALATGARQSVQDSEAAYFSIALNGSISGTVFEDINYGGGIGRSRATAVVGGGSGRPGARVELFDGSGNYVSATTTDGSGNYTFSSLANGNYTVRVVNSSVSSARSGYVGGTHLAVQTYRTDASASTTAADVYDRVGGETPNLADAGNGATTLAALTTGSTTAQSIAPVTIANGSVSGMDFGYSFSLVVNTNNSGQGSLRQFITQANALAHNTLALSGRTAATEHAVFMIANGSNSPGLRAGLNYFSAGVATITPGFELAVSAPLVIDAQTQPGFTSNPIVELAGSGAGAGSDAFWLSAGNSTVRGFIINRWPDKGIALTSGGNTVQGNWVGLNNTGTSASANGVGIHVQDSTGNSIGGSAASQRNVISGNAGGGLRISAADATRVLGNYIGTDIAGQAAIGGGGPGVQVDGGSVGVEIGGSDPGAGNVISGTNHLGIHALGGATGLVVQGNLIGRNSSNTAALGNRFSGIWLNGVSNSTIGLAAGGTGAPNTIAHNSIGVFIDARGVGNRISGNAIYGNVGSGAIAGLGIELIATGTNCCEGVNPNDGAKPSATSNLSMDHPVFTTADISGSNLIVAGYVGTAAGQSLFAGSRVEVFVSDDDAAGFGEGRAYVGFVIADSAGNFAGSIPIPGTVTFAGAASRVTGTATDGAGNTSEFGPNFTATTVLAGFWPLDETSGTSAADVVAGNNGVHVNGVWLGEGIRCRGRAAWYDGVDDYTEVPHRPAYLLDQGTLALWIRPDALPTSRRALWSKDSAGFDDGGHLTLWLRTDGRIEAQLQSASATTTLQSSQAVAAGQWSHVAFSWGPGGMRLHVNGAAPATDPYAGGLGTSSGGSGNAQPFTLGASTAGAADLVAAPLADHYRGFLDDVRLYPWALGDVEIGVLAAPTDCNNGPASFTVEQQAGGPIGTQFAGVPFNLRLTARDGGGAVFAAFDSAVAVSSTGALTQGAGRSANFSAGVLVPHTVSIANVGTFSVSATAVGGAVGTSNPFNVIAPVGRFNAFEPGTAAGAVDGVIRTKIAGAPFTLDLAAINHTGTGYWTATEVAPVTVQLLDASDNSGTLDATNCRASWTVLSTVATGFTFATSDAGRKSLTLSLNEARRAVRVRMSSSALGGATGCSTDAFAVRPAAFTGVQAADANDSTPGTARVLDNATPTAGVVHRAGRDFSVLGSATSSSGAVLAGYNGSPTLSVTGCVEPAGCSAGALSVVTLGAAGGMVTGSARYSEAGAVSVVLRDTDFAAIDAGDGSSDAERTIVSASATFGRFVPDAYRLSWVAAPTLAAAACGAGPATQAVVFAGQNFGFTAAPSVLATPINAAGASLANARARFAATAVTTSLVASNNPLAFTGSVSAAGVAHGTTSTVTFGTSALRFERGNTPVASFSPTLALTISLADATETATAGNTTINHEAPLALASVPFAGGAVPFHFGRLRLQPTYGDLRQPLTVPLEVQSFNGTGWVGLPGIGNCVAAAATDFAYVAPSGALAGGGGAYTCASRVSGTVVTSAGRAQIVLPAPGALDVRQAAAVTLRLNVGAANGQTCNGASAAPATSSGLAWLADRDVSSGNYAADPAARITWGRSRGSFVQVRERFD